MPDAELGGPGGHDVDAGAGTKFPKRKVVRLKPLAAIDLWKNHVGTGLVRLRGLGLRRVALPAIYVI
jgi:hypothetical protein